MTQLKPPTTHPSAHLGALYTYAPNLAAFEGNVEAPCTLLWIGGLYCGIGDGPANVKNLEEYIKDVGEGWSVVQSIRSSSYNAWGTGSVKKDVEEIIKLVEFVAKLKKRKIVLMGHSTVCSYACIMSVSRELIALLAAQGCQDVIAFFHHLSSNSSPTVSPELQSLIVGAALLAPVSDRQACTRWMSTETIESLTTPPPGSTLDDIVGPYDPKEPLGPARITYRRWRSLLLPPASTEPGSKLDVEVCEDFFSTDLPDHYLKETVLNEVNKPLLVLLNEKDESYDKELDLKGWFKRFDDATPEGSRSEFSGIVEGADHSVLTEEAQQRLYKRVGGFLQSLS